MTVPLSIEIPVCPKRRSSAPTPTNSLVIAGMPMSFFHPVILDALRDHFASYGELYAWAPIRAFARIILVYYSDGDAENAKRCCDGFRIGATANSQETVLRVYRGEPTPIPTTTDSGSSSPSHPLEKKYSPYHLCPPAIEKNFLISPPGSPPVGWESLREEPPNNAPLADDLIVALRKLQFSQEQDSPSSSNGVSVLIEPQEGPGVGIYVEDCGDESPTSSESDESARWDRDGGFQGEGWFYSKSATRARFIPAPTSMPPRPAAV